MSNWTVSVGGLRTVMELELRQRVRSRRWIWALIGWFVLVGLLTSLVIWASSSVAQVYDQPGAATSTNGTSAGPMAFALITFLVLGLGLMIAPAFTATSINGDRNAGTLATLQVTKISAAEIALGKLLAAWLVAAVFLVVALPFIAWAMVLGSISWWQVLVTFVVLFVEVAVICAIGLGMSSLTTRPGISAMLTYLVVVVLTSITTVVVVLSTALVQEDRTVRVWGLPPLVEQRYQDQVLQTKDSAAPPPVPVDKCAWFERTDLAFRMDRVWWILVANPAVIVADAAPLPPGAQGNLSAYIAHTTDPLAIIRSAVRSMSMSPATEKDECIQYYDELPGYHVVYDNQGHGTVFNSRGQVVTVSPVKNEPVTAEYPIWPWGLGFHLLLGGLFFWMAVRRLSVPAGKLPPGTRVA